MSELKISELKPAGAELFEDNENYIQDLTDEEMTDVVGAYGGDGLKASVVNNSAKSVINGDITIFNNSVFTANGNTIVGNTVGNGVTAVSRR